MRPLFLVFLIVILSQSLYSQDYNELIKLANKAHEDSAYLESGKYYEQAFSLHPSPWKDHLYSAACSFSLANNVEKALDYLGKAVEKGYDDVNSLLLDVELNYLRSNPKFIMLVERLKIPNTIYTKDILEDIKLNTNGSLRYDGKKINWSMLRSGYHNPEVLKHFNNDSLRISFTDCEVEQLRLGGVSLMRLSFEKTHFKESATFQDVNLQSLTFGRCNFNNNLIRLSIVNIDDLSFYGGHWVGFHAYNSTIKYSFVFADTLDLSSHSTKWSNVAFESESSTSKLSFESSKLNLDFKSIPLSERRINKSKSALAKMDSNINEKDDYFNSSMEIKGNWDRIFINDTYFGGQNDNTKFYVTDATIRSFLINNSIFDVPIFFNNLNITERAEITGNSINRYLAISKVLFPEQELLLDWSQIDGGKFKSLEVLPIVVEKDTTVENFEWYQGDYFEYPVIYQGSNSVELTNKTFYKNYVKSYNSLLNYYKTQGDKESYNACYSEMRDLEGRLLNHEYNENPNFKSFFGYMLNRMMKAYTNHGTDPALAVLVSFYIIFGFAVFYFFFPSEWDVTSKGRMIANFQDFTQKNDKGYVKPFFVMIGGFMVSLLNAITLSLNSFVTLGFGTIPTTGLARYVCIVQGFIGWFLLSLFTVALINQVLF